MKRNRKSVKFNKLLQLVGRKMVFKDFKDKIRFLRTFKDRAIFFRNLRNLRTSGRPDTVKLGQRHSGVTARDSGRVNNSTVVQKLR